MPLRINVGLSKKLGLPNYGSAGASCNVEFELETGQILQDPEGLHRNIQNAYGACRQAVQDELSRQVNPNPVSAIDGESPSLPEPSGDPAHGPPAGSANGSPNGNAPKSANGDSSGLTTPATCGQVQTSPAASRRQLNFIHHLAHGISGLTPRRLEILAATVCGKRLAHLTTADASQLINTLKQIEAGVMDFSGTPQEVSA